MIRRPQSVVNLLFFSNAGCRVEDDDDSKCLPEVNDGICQSHIEGVYKMAMVFHTFQDSPRRGRYGFKRRIQWNLSASMTALWPWLSRLSTKRNHVLATVLQELSLQYGLEISHTVSPWAAPFYFHVVLRMQASTPT